jgi:endo-1,4-beta-xylanase
MWGFIDAHPWVPGSYPGFRAALPFDENYQKKPAYDTLSERLRGC